MKTYIAKGPHKRTCDLCNEPVLPGDRVAMWCFVAEDVSDSNIIRAHETCNTIYEREGMEEFCRGEAFGGSELEKEAKELLAETRRTRAQEEVTRILGTMDCRGRQDLFNLLGTRYHLACGAADPDCQCENDE